LKCNGSVERQLRLMQLRWQQLLLRKQLFLMTGYLVNHRRDQQLSAGPMQEKQLPSPQSGTVCRCPPSPPSVPAALGPTYTMRQRDRTASRHRHMVTYLARKMSKARLFADIKSNIVESSTALFGGSNGDEGLLPQTAAR